MVWIAFLGCKEIIDENFYDSYYRSIPVLGSKELSVLTLNIWSPGPDPDSRVRMVIERLRQLDPTIIFLQETMNSVTGNAGVRIAKELNASLVYSPGTRSEGLAIISKLNLYQSHQVSYSLKEHDTRQVIGAETILDNPFDRGLLGSAFPLRSLRLTLLNTHLSSPLEASGMRLEQATELAENAPRFIIGVTDDGPILDNYPASAPIDRSYFCTRAEAFFILAGDFNAPDDEQVIRCLGAEATGCPFHSELVDTFRQTNLADPGFTWSQTNPNTHAYQEPDRRLDYIFLGIPGCRRGDAAPFIRSSRLVFNTLESGSFPSDHFGVLTRIQLPGHLVEK